MGEITAIVGFAISVCSVVISCYLWLVKTRGERPQLRVCKAEPRIGGYAQSSCTNPIKLILDVKVIVANNSTLPNALLGLRSWVKSREGKWLEAETTVDPKTPLPMNLSALQTVRLNLSAAVAVPAVPEGEACRNTNETFVLYRERYLAQPIQVRVEVSDLGDQAFAGVVASTKMAA